MQPRTEHFRGVLLASLVLSFDVNGPTLDALEESVGCCSIKYGVGGVGYDTASEPRLWE